MNIDSDKAEALYQLSVDRTFSRAASSLGISQPALSKKIARLEDELESNLVIRSSKGLVFTDAGLELIQYYIFKKDLDYELLSKLSLNNEKELIGELNIATYSSVGRSAVLPSLASLSSEFQGIKINFLIKEVRDLEKSLTSGESNFVVSNVEIIRDGIFNKIIGSEENVHVVPVNPKTIDYFLDHDRQDKTTIDFLNYQGIESNIKRNYFDEVYAIIDAVGLGMGQAIVSKHLVSKNTSLRIKKYKKRMIMPVYLCYFDRPYIPLLQKRAIETLSKNLKKFL